MIDKFPNFKMLPNLAGKDILPHRVNDVLAYDQDENVYCWASDGKPLDKELCYVDSEGKTTVYPNMYLFEPLPCVGGVVVLSQYYGFKSKIRNKKFVFYLRHTDIVQELLDTMGDGISRNIAIYLNTPSKKASDYEAPDWELLDVRCQNFKFTDIGASKLFGGYTVIGVIRARFINGDKYQHIGYVLSNDATGEFLFVEIEENLSAIKDAQEQGLL